MKFFSFGCLLFVFCISGKAQNDFRFADPTAVWNLHEFYYWAPSGSEEMTVTYRVQKDTTFNGFDYQKIIPRPSYSSNFIFIREDSTAKVFVNDDYYLYPESERLVYDFSLNEGDTFKFFNPHPQDTIILMVDSTDTVTYGTPRKRMFMKCISEDDCFDITWIEGIGSLNSHFLSPLVYEFEPEGSSYELLCFTENGVTYNFSPTCFVGIEAVSNYANSISVSPNPAQTNINIQFSEPSWNLQSILMHNITGMEVATMQVSELEVTMNIQALPSGIYFCRMILSNGSRVEKK